MKNLLNRIITERYHLILNEEDVLNTVSVLNKHKIYNDMAMGNCGWADKDKWFINFTSTKAKWELIRKELDVVRVYENTDIPKDVEGVIFTTN